MMVADAIVKTELTEVPKPEPLNMASLYAKKAAVMGLLSRVKKSGYNKHFKYEYATAEDVADAVRAAMSECGLSYSLNIIDCEISGEGSRTLWKVTVDFIFGCSESGAKEVCRYLGYTFDSQDKGFNQAVTSAEKYFLMKTFIMSAGDEADADANPDAGPQRQSNGRQQTQQPTAPATPWHMDEAKSMAFREFIFDNFALKIDEALDALNKSEIDADWSFYSTGQAAIDALKLLAMDGNIPVVAHKAAYFTTATGKKPFVFDTIIDDDIWYFGGRTKLAALSAKMAALKDLEAKGSVIDKADLPEPVAFLLKSKTDDDGVVTFTADPKSLKLLGAPWDAETQKAFEEI